MKLYIRLWTAVIFIILHEVSKIMTTQWDRIASSKSYENTRLVMETVNRFLSLNISKENSAANAQIICSKFCANNATCLGFNFYTVNDHYVCEFLPDNFCSKRKRIALQNWPGGTVMDKLGPGMTKACIDQQFENKSTSNYCETGRSGCRNRSNTSSTAWPGCDNCVKTCIDCTTLNNITGSVGHICTLWPGGPSESPIFAFCFGTATYLMKRGVNTATGTVSPNYRMSLKDMYRISRLTAYKTIGFYFRGIGKDYYTKYENFSINEKGTLTDLKIKSAAGDGFNVFNKSFEPCPWIEATSRCGSFWYLNSTQVNATQQGPGGDINMFGSVDVKVTPKETGIRWPDATKNGILLNYTDTKIDTT